MPRPVRAIAKGLAGLRFGIDWAAMDYLSRANALSVPILLFHGDADELVPISTSDELARIRPDIVRYERVDRAPHAGVWNTDREGYEAAVWEFLTRTAA